MALSRRKTLALLGGGLVVAAGASAAGFAVTRTPTQALAPWGAAGQYDDPRLNALSFAILAPNPHNRQPWMAELIGTDGLRIFRDPSRRLPHTDPFDRQMTIGMGCFLELMRVAAASAGFSLNINLFPDGEGDDVPTAEIRFIQGAAPDPLFAMIMSRRSSRVPFEDRMLSASDREYLADFATLITDTSEVAAIRALTWQALLIEMNTDRTLHESVELMRFGKAEIDASPDGISIGGPFLEALMLIGQLDRAGQSDRASASFQYSKTIYQTMLDATPAYAVITTQANSRADQIAAGARWLRLSLACAEQGVLIHPVSQSLQEYAEMAAPFAEIHDMLAPENGTVQMLGRLGYGPEMPQSPRWPMESRLLNA
jgi:hypothetical protein